MRALVLGLGRFSGGVETVRWLRAEGAEVLVSDAAPREALEAPAAEAEALGARLVFGPQAPPLLEGMDLVVASPAIPFDHPVLTAALARGLPVTTETNLFLERVRAPVFGVTGTKGKSTTATLLAGILEAAGRRVHLGGNVGRALLATVDRIAPGDVVVLELSSFQLWWADRIRRSPHVALLTNLFPDHLDRHGTFEAYAAAKRAAFAWQGPQDVSVLPADDPAVRAAGFTGAGRGRRVTFGAGGDVRDDGDQVRAPDGFAADVSDFPLWGAHNRRDLLAAAAAAWAGGGVRPEHVTEAARRARPLPHRLEPVVELDGVLYVDDSNATTPQSTIEALRAVPRPAVVLVGGKDKGADARPLVDALRRRAAAVVGTGTTGPALVAALAGDLPAVVGGPTMAASVRIARSLARPGEAVLLSPGYSSLDEHPSFAVRGDRFRAAALGAPVAPGTCGACGERPAAAPVDHDLGRGRRLRMGLCAACAERLAARAARPGPTGHAAW